MKNVGMKIFCSLSIVLGGIMLWLAADVGLDLLVEIPSAQIPAFVLMAVVSVVGGLELGAMIAWNAVQSEDRLLSNVLLLGSLIVTAIVLAGVCGMMYRGDVVMGEALITLFVAPLMVVLMLAIWPRATGSGGSGKRIYPCSEDAIEEEDGGIIVQKEVRK